MKDQFAPELIAFINQRVPESHARAALSIHCRCFGDVDELCDLVIHMVHLARTQQEYRHGLQRQVGSVLRSILAQLQDDDSQDLCKAWAQVHARLARLGVPEDLWPDQEELANASPKASQEGHFLLKGVWRFWLATAIAFIQLAMTAVWLFLSRDYCGRGFADFMA